MADDLAGVPQTPLPLPKESGRPVGELPNTKTQTPPPLEPKPQIPSQQAVEPMPSVPPSSPPQPESAQKTSRELLDELLPMDESSENIKNVPKTPMDLPTEPQQNKSMETDRPNNLEEEIFPSPKLEEEPPTETPEELLGINAEKPAEQPPTTTPQPPVQTPTPPPAPPATPTQQPYVPPTSPPGKKSFFLSKTMILTIILVIIGAALTGAGLYYFVLSGDEEPTETPNDEPVETPDETPVVDTTPPAPFVTPDFMLENISVQDALEGSLTTMLNSLKNSALTADTITYVPIRLAGVTVDNKAQYLKLQTLFSGLNISTPIDFFEIFESDFMLYIYTSANEERVACQNNLVTEGECWGPRVGIVFKAKAGNANQLPTILDQWKDIVEASSSNLEAFLLSDIAQMPETLEFGEGIYVSDAVLSAPDVAVYFANIPMPKYDNLELSGTALDFAIVDDMLIFATSKNSLNKMIDYILLEQ